MSLKLSRPAGPGQLQERRPLPRGRRWDEKGQDEGPSRAVPVLASGPAVEVWGCIRFAPPGPRCDFNGGPPREAAFRVPRRRRVDAKTFSVPCQDGDRVVEMTTTQRGCAAHARGDSQPDRTNTAIDRRGSRTIRPVMRGRTRRAGGRTLHVSGVLVRWWLLCGPCSGTVPGLTPS